MVVVDGWPLLKNCEAGDLASLARLRERLASRVSPTRDDSSSDVTNVPWRTSEREWLVEAFTVITKCLLSQNAIRVTEAADTDALRCCALLLGTGGAKVLEEHSLNLLSDLVHGLSLRAAARAKETAFKRSLCVYILAIVGVELEVHSRENPANNAVALQLSTVCLSEIRRWQKEFGEIDMLIRFLDWRKNQKPAWNWVLYGFVAPVLLGCTWYVFHARRGNPDWFRHDFVFYVCFVCILGAFALPNLFSGQLNESNGKINSALRTLLHMCAIVSPPKPESDGLVYVSGCRAEGDGEDRRNDDGGHPRMMKVGEGGGEGERRGEGEGEGQGNVPIEIPNDMSEKLERLVKIMEETSASPEEIERMKQRLQFAKSLEARSMPST
jgi:hypothetical protein